MVLGVWARILIKIKSFFLDILKVKNNKNLELQKKKKNWKNEV